MTYTSDDAIKSGISLRELNLKQSVALCLVYLAKGYANKYGREDNAFLFECSEQAIKNDPKNLSAMLLKAEILEEKLLKNNRTIEQLSHDKTFIAYENLLNKLYTLGYRQMPIEMRNLILSKLKKDTIPVIAKDNTPRPFTSLNVSDPRYATLSWGLFEEIQKDEKEFKYSRTILNVEKRKIVNFVKEDMTYENQYIDPVVFAWCVDPMAHMRASWNPYNFCRNNPILNVDPNGALDTDYYDKDTGEHFEHIDDGIDEAVAIDKNVYKALKEEGELKNTTSKTVGGISLGTNTDFEMIVATLYAEAGYKYPEDAESAAIYDVLENRSNVSDKTECELIKAGGIYGYGSKDYKIALSKGNGYEKSEYSLSRHNTARKGAMLGIANANSILDFSQGAYFWDASVYLENPTKHKTNFFNKIGHGTTVGTSSKNITFSYTTKIGATQFMKYNYKLYPKKIWP